MIKPEFHHYVLSYESSEPKESLDNNVPPVFESRISLSMTTDDVLLYFRTENVEIIGASDGMEDFLTIHVSTGVSQSKLDKSIGEITNLLFSLLAGYARGIGGGKFDQWIDDMDDSHHLAP